MRETYDLTRGRVTFQLLGFYFPMLLANIMQQTYSFVDTVVVGKGIGDHALGAVGNLSSLILLVTGVLMGITNGFSVNIAQSFGADDNDLLRRNIAYSIKLCAAITIGLTLISLILLKPLLIFMQTSPYLLADSLLYGLIIFGGLPVTSAYHLFSSTLRAIGDSRTPLKAILISSAINILLDCLLIFYFRTGVGGAALATVFSQAISVLVCGFKLCDHGVLSLQLSNFVGDPSVQFSLLKNGIPAACMNSVTAVGCIFVQGYVNALGPAVTSAYSAYSKYLNLAMLPSVTVGYALSAFVSQNKGAGKAERIRNGVWTGVAIAVASWFAVGSVMILLPDQLAALMLNNDVTIALTAELLRICGSMLLLLNLLFVFRSAVQGMGRPLIPMCSGILEMGLRIVVIKLMMTELGFRAAAYAEGIAWFGALLLNSGAYRIFIHKEHSEISQRVRSNCE